jgi:hypothetical protein
MDKFSLIKNFIIKTNIIFFLYENKITLNNSNYFEFQRSGNM